MYTTCQGGIRILNSSQHMDVQAEQSDSGPHADLLRRRTILSPHHPSSVSDRNLEWFQPSDTRTGRWLRRRVPLSLRHIFFPFTNNNYEFPSLLIKRGF
jgi:hypothetical protein